MVLPRRSAGTITVSVRRLTYRNQTPSDRPRTALRGLMGEARRRRLAAQAAQAERDREALRQRIESELHDLFFKPKPENVVPSNLSGGTLTNGGIQFDPTGRKLNEQEVPEDQHNWQGILTYNLSTATVKKLFSKTEQVQFDMENLSGYYAGCLKCGMPAQPDTVDTPCIGDVIE